MKNITDAAIYVGTYAKYNAGSIFGKWLKLADYSSKHEFYLACAELHKNESDPEFMFQAFEHIPRDLISESYISDVVFDIINKADEIENISAFESYLAHKNISFENGEKLEDVLSDFTDCFEGEFESVEEFAESHYEAIYTIEESLKGYIDYEKVANDLFSGEFTFVDGCVFNS